MKPIEKSFGQNIFNNCYDKKVKHPKVNIMSVTSIAKL